MPRKKNPQPQEMLPSLRPISPAETEEEQEHDDPDVAAIEEHAAAQGFIQAPQKKKYRPSKKDIPDYPFREAHIQEIAEFVKQHPNLYDKRDKQWCNPKLKETLWKELAGTFPDCTYLQVRKFFEAKRTDFGKIEKRESRSGAPARERTTREESIMSTWSFLGGHIAHETTQPSDRFSPSQGPSLSHMQLEHDPS